MPGSSPFRFGVLFFLIAIPYLCDVFTANELTDNLVSQQVTLLETDLDDDKASGTLPSLDITVVQNQIPKASAFSGTVNLSSVSRGAQTVIAVSGCRPPPSSL